MDDELFQTYTDILSSAARSSTDGDSTNPWPCGRPAPRIERAFDPAEVRELKAAADADLTVGGANLAAQALKAGLVDECQLFVWPASVGGGKLRCPPTRASTWS